MAVKNHKDTVKKKDGFKGQKAIVLPRQVIQACRDQQLLSNLYITDIGYYPKAAFHFRERDHGCNQHILIYCTGGKGWAVVDGNSVSVKEGEYLVIPAGAKYFHYTTNNTIEGTQMHEIPETDVPLVADMSSDILSRVMDFNRFDLIYAGAQKNIGAAGVNMVIVKKGILGKVDRKLPTMMDYRQHIEAGSVLNTPPVFAIYVCMLTLRWLKEQGGVAAIERINDQKAALLYDTLDSLPIFRPTVAKEDRSKMNVVFVMEDKALEKEFLAACKENGMVGIQGHRTAGGFRASLYNAMSLESVRVLTELMKEFATQKA